VREVISLLGIIDGAESDILVPDADDKCPGGYFHCNTTGSGTLKSKGLKCVAHNCFSFEFAPSIFRNCVSGSLAICHLSTCRRRANANRKYADMALE